MNDVYRAFYTKSDDIVSYMVSKLSVESGMRILEPCAGDGVFIDALLGMIPDVSVDAYELNPEAVGILKVKYLSNSNVDVILDDTITNHNLLSLSNGGGIYDRVIANPPYGGWIEYDKRKYLKKLYPSIYTKETYTLFLYQCIRLLKDNGILVFITPDTFLNLHMHMKLRVFLLTNTKIKEICWFPSSFFPEVNFGYSNLCITTLQRCSNINQCLNNEVRVITGLKDVSELKTLSERTKSHHRVFTLKQNDIYDNIDHAFLISENPEINSLITRHNVRIGDIADCVTGFYSGDDKKYLHPISRDIKNARRYEIQDRSLICDDYATRQDILEGISDSRHFIPIVKGGGKKYYKQDTWYMDWGVEAIRNYKANGKARFQNAQYYFKDGIGIPMVSSSRITAALMENRLFDQSIVGVFPKDRKYTYYLLALFNSPTCNKLIRTINPSTNNSANYIKKIPFIPPSGEILKKIDNIVNEIIYAIKAGKSYPATHELVLNNLIETIHGC